MTRTLLIISLVLFSECKNSNKQSLSLPTSLSLEADTLKGTQPKIDGVQDGSIELDTILFDANKRHTGIQMVLPVLSASPNDPIQNQIKRLRETLLNDFLDLATEKSVYVKDKAPHGLSMWIEPKSIYKRDSLFSLIIERGRANSDGPSTFEYHTINYDYQLKRNIEFADYFEIKNYTDTLAFCRIIMSQISSKELNSVLYYLQNEGGFTFSFDRENVYLCFDKGHLLGGGIVSIQRKAILPLINSKYHSDKR